MKPYVFHVTNGLLCYDPSCIYKRDLNFTRILIIMYRKRSFCPIYIYIYLENVHMRSDEYVKLADCFLCLTICRLYSHFKKVIGKGASPEDFHDRVMKHLPVWNKCVEDRGIRSCTYDMELKPDGKTSLASIYHIGSNVTWKGLIDLSFSYHSSKYTQLFIKKTKYIVCINF